jgi:hypothetical protein
MHGGRVWIVFVVDSPHGFLRVVRERAVELMRVFAVSCSTGLYTKCAHTSVGGVMPCCSVVSAEALRVLLPKQPVVDAIHAPASRGVPAKGSCGRCCPRALCSRPVHVTVDAGVWCVSRARPCWPSPPSCEARTRRARRARSTACAHGCSGSTRAVRGGAATASRRCCTSEPRASWTRRRWAASRQTSLWPSTPARRLRCRSSTRGHTCGTAPGARGRA